MTNLELYDFIRQIHNDFKEIALHRYDELTDIQKLSVDAISDVLYLAESNLSKQDF